MVQIQTNKPDAARRQIEAAIRMLFGEEDLLAVHTMIGAGFRILRDLAEQSGESEFHNLIKSLIRPGKERACWEMINRVPSFLKHADKDPDGTLEISEDLIDFLVLLSCLYYESIGHALTTVMRGFVAWFCAIYPDQILDDAPFKAALADRCFDHCRKMPRGDQLKLGKLVCQWVAEYEGRESVAAI